MSQFDTSVKKGIESILKCHNISLRQTSRAIAKLVLEENWSLAAVERELHAITCILLHERIIIYAR
jgi:hypothetical protein